MHGFVQQLRANLRFLDHRRRSRFGLLRLVAGQMAPELLNSVNVRPAALERAGYDFEDEDVREVLAAALS